MITSFVTVSADIALGKTCNPMWFLDSRALKHMTYSHDASSIIFLVLDQLHIFTANNTTLLVNYLSWHCLHKTTQY